MPGREGPSQLRTRTVLPAAHKRRDEGRIEAQAERLRSERDAKEAHQMGVLRLAIGLITRSTMARS